MKNPDDFAVIWISKASLPSTDTSLMFSKPAGTYLFKVKNGNTKQINEIYSKITKNAP